MKVVLVNDQLNAGGAEKVLVNIANLLYKNGIQVSVVMYLKPAVLDNLIHPSIPVHYLERKGRFDLKAMRLLKKIVSAVDIIHVHSRYNLRYLVVAKYITGIYKPAIVFHEHVPVLSVDTFTKFIIRKAGAYVAVLKSMCTWAQNDLKIPASKIFYLPNTVNAPAVPIEAAKAGKKILMVGNFWKFKNQVFAINLIKALPTDYTLDMYGMVNDDEYYKSLQQLISDSNLGSRIKLIHGMSDIYKVAGDYSFAIHTSPHETGPLVLLEYMHAGLPFLTYNTGDVVTQIQNDLPEAILKSFEPGEWIRRIEEVMMIEDARHTVRLKMERILNEHYTEDIYWNKLQNIYNAVLE